MGVFVQWERAMLFSRKQVSRVCGSRYHAQRACFPHLDWLAHGDPCSRHPLSSQPVDGLLALMHGPSEVASVSRRGGMVLGRLALFPKVTCASRRNRNDIQERDAVQARAIAWRAWAQISATWLMTTVSDFSAEPRISLVPHWTPEEPSLSPIRPESGALVLVWPRARLNFELVHRRTASRSKKVGSSDDDGSTSGIDPAPTTPTPATPARRAFDRYQTAVGPGQKCLGRFWTR